jgi:hypothetical protein
MKKLQFRTLNADEIDVRVSSVKKDGSAAMMLLYKDARVDQNILDETVGPFNWQRKHSRDNANCTVSLWDEEKKEWISKEDTGTESFSEAEKGLASDSFKRACFNWGVGRELYTAPTIWVNKMDETDMKYVRLSVKDIAYDDKRRITSLTLIDNRGRVRFSYGNGKTQAQASAPQTAPQPAPQKPGARLDQVINEVYQCKTKAEIARVYKAYPYYKNNEQLIQVCKEQTQKLSANA